jgi:putative exosortase-associated protein (TIGR04073 family)
MLRFIAAVALSAVLFLPSAGMAYTAVDKLGRGLATMTTGFLELPGNMVAESRDHGTAAGLTVGFAKGLGMIVVRELVGVYEFVTSPIPVPDNYRPIIQPEYPWDYFEGSSSSRPAV